MPTASVPAAESIASVDELLRLSGGDAGVPDSTAPLVRKRARYDPMQDKIDAMHVQERPSFRPQYASIYYARLQQIGAALERVAGAEWQGSRVRILDAKAEQQCWVVGTIFVDAHLKPNVLEDLARDLNIATDYAPKASYWDPTDTVYIEDDSGRVPLLGDRVFQDCGGFVTGAVVALLGTPTSTGEFTVEDIRVPGLPRQEPRASPEQGEKYVAFISGLELGAVPADDVRVEMLLEFFRGESGSQQDQILASSIVRVIIAGNTVGIPRPSSPTRKVKRYSALRKVLDDRPIDLADTYLEKLCESTPVDLMTGAADPAERLLPQRPLQTRALFPQASEYSTLHSVSNPHWCAIDGTTILTSSGEALNDCMRYTRKESDGRLKMAIQMLRWQHIAPTAPDTLWCHPFGDLDPFVLDACPHVFACGDQPSFSTAIVNGDSGQQVRVVLIPRFALTGSIILMRIDSPGLECRELKFGSWLPKDVERTTASEVVEEVDEDEQVVVIEHGMDDDD